MTVEIDPVCGMPISPSEGLHLDHEGRSLSFCSEFCRGAFHENYERYSGQSPRVRRENDQPSRLIAYFSTEVGVDEGKPKRNEAWFISSVARRFSAIRGVNL
jgi:YHS domain-containing protein